MPLVSSPSSFACRAERLAGTTPGPDWFVVPPSCESKRVAPDSDAREKMTLRISGEVAGVNVADVALIYVARRNVAGRDEIAQPLRGVGVDFVVVRIRHR